MIAVMLLFSLVLPVQSLSPGQLRLFHVSDNVTRTSSFVQQRRDMLKFGSFLVASALGLDVNTANAMEQKIYSSNAKNMARLSTGDSSGGSVYDNNPSSPKARRRRAMVGCKNSSARSVAGKMIGQNSLSEKECNLIVMEGDGTFMLQALSELDCPTCPYGIATR